jgi:hypothetical protein
MLSDVESIYKESAAEKKAKKAGRAKSIKSAGEEISNALSTRKDELTTEQIKANKMWVRGSIKEAKKLIKRGLGWFANVETVADILDGGKSSSIHDHIIQPIVEGKRESLEFTHTSEDFVVDALNNSPVDVTNWSSNQSSGIAGKAMDKNILRDTFNTANGIITMTKAEQVGFVRTIADEAGLRHLLKGGLVIGETTTEFEIGDIYEIMDEIDDDVFTVADIFDDYYAMEGQYLDSFMRDATGLGLDLSKKHQPLLIEGEIVGIDPEFNSLNEITNRLNKRTFQKGATKARKSNANGAVILEDIFTTQARSSRDVGTFVGLSKSVPYVTSVLKNVRNDMKQKGLMEEWAIMNNSVENVGASDPSLRVAPSIARAYSGARKLFISGALGFKGVTAALQSISAGNYFTLVDDMENAAMLGARIPDLVATNTARYTANITDDSSINEEMFQYSPMIRERIESTNIEKDISESGSDANSRRVLNRVTSKGTSEKALGYVNLNTQMKPIAFMDKVAIKTIWDLAKMEADMEGIEDNKMEWVANRAEQVIRQTQPTFDNFDKPQISKVPVLKEMTMFASQRGKYVNMSYRAMAKITEGNVKGGVRDLVWITAAVPAAIAAIKGVFNNALRGKEEEYEDKDVRYFVSEYLKAYAGNYPVIGEVIENIAEDRQFRPGGVVSAQGGAVVQLAQALKTGDEEKIKKARERLAIAYGIPAGAFEIRDIVKNITE